MSVGCPVHRAPNKRRKAGLFRPPALPRAIWALGFTSLLMDVSSEMIHALLPVFLVTGLGASALVVGLIDGAAEALALVADFAPPAQRGAAFGLFNLASGGAMLLASVGAGWLWDRHGPAAPFVAGAVLAGAAALVLLLQRIDFGKPTPP